MTEIRGLRLREGQRILIQGCPFEIKEITHRAIFIEPLKRVRYTVANDVMQVHTWPDYPVISIDGRLLDGNEELAPVVKNMWRTRSFTRGRRGSCESAGCF